MDKELFNLTYPQKNIWLVEKYNGKSPINLIVGTIEIKDKFDEGLCKEAIEYVIKNNDALRINIVEKQGEVLQYINNDYNYNAEVIDLTQYNEQQILDWKSNMAKLPFNTSKKELYDFFVLKYSENSGAIYMKIHHLVGDAWSCGKMATQAIKYIETKLGNIVDSEDKIYSYLDYIKAENEYIDSEKFAKDENFWKEYLVDINESISIKDNKNSLSKANRYCVSLTKKFTNKINEYCKENKISPYVLFMTALSTYLYRIKNSNDFIIGTPVLNRANFKEKNTVGMFVSTLPLRVKIDEKQKFMDLAHNISSNTLTLFRHQKYPYEKILDFVYKNNPNIHENLYNIVLSYQNVRADMINEEIYSTTWPFTECLNDELQIHITDMDDTGILSIKYDYLSDLFKEKEIKFIHSRMIAIIENAINDINIDIDEIDIMNNEEKDYLLNKINDNIDTSYYKKYKSVIDTFESQAEKNPDGVALIFEDVKYKYSELNEKANKLADYLMKYKNVKQGDIVAIAMSRNEQIVMAMLAILKLRATYLLIDPTFPSSRISDMIENVKLVVTNKDDYSWLKDVNYVDLYKESDEINKCNLNNKKIEILHEQLDYIIYTSGTTGKPKGVMISDKNLLNFCIGINKELNFNKESRIVSITTVSFDIFGLEIWLILLNGGCIVLANANECIRQDKLNLLCKKHNVNIIQGTPTKLKLLTSSNNNIEFISNMKTILIGGESIPDNYIKFLKENTKSQIYNVYGPSETTIWSTLKNITKEDNVTAGKVIQNTKIYILDEKHRVLPIECIGELCISGDSVSSGYYNREDLTEKAFVKFGNERIYKTGDLAFIDSNGDLNILGRNDYQVKINGQRVELEEIEKQVLNYKNVNDVAVVKNVQEKLLCFYTLKNNEEEIDTKKLRKKLMSKLPVYMVPNHYICLEKLPQTLNNKIDRKNLINYKVDGSINLNEIILPKTKLQQDIYDSWKKVLPNKEFGINTNFFDLGTDSLDAIKVQIELMSKDIKITYADIQKHQTIISLEKKILKKEGKEEIKKDKLLEYDEILSRNNFEIKDYPKHKIKKVILTGVTGFLGSHILDSLMKETDCIIYCLIRQKDTRTVEERLRSKLKFFFDDKYDNQIGKRIIPVKADIIKNENFDVSLHDLKLIGENVDFIVHAAACVKHYGDYEYFYDVNVKTTQNVVKFALNNNIKMIHISTISVSGNSFEGAIVAKNKEKIEFDETMLYNGQDISNVYVNTKFQAEEIVLDYMKKGLHANILRVGNLTSRMSDYKFQPNIEENAFVNRVKTFIKIGEFPKDNVEDMYIEFTPVDITANSIIKIMEYFNEDHNMFHIFNHNHVYLKELLKILKKVNINIDIVSNDEFKKKIKEISNSKEKEILSGIINDLSDNFDLDYAINIIVKSDITKKYLKSIGFEWNKITEEYIINYIKNLKEIGFLEF